MTKWHWQNNIRKRSVLSLCHYVHAVMLLICHYIYVHTINITSFLHQDKVLLCRLWQCCYIASVNQALLAVCLSGKGSEVLHPVDMYIDWPWNIHNLDSYLKMILNWINWFIHNPAPIMWRELSVPYSGTMLWNSLFSCTPIYTTSFPGSSLYLEKVEREVRESRER